MVSPEKTRSLTLPALFYTPVRIGAATLEMMMEIDRVFTEYSFFHRPAGSCTA